ncbi:MAG: hypothetical protein ACI9T9_002953, partial [Oleiphilaceae bacterium]
YSIETSAQPKCHYYFNNSNCLLKNRTIVDLINHED